MSRTARAFFLRLVENLSHDLRVSLRMLRREPKFAASAILPLALGMAAATAVYSVAYGFFLRPLPVRDEGSLAVVYAGDRVRDDAPISYPRFRAWQASGVFEGLASVSTRSLDIVIDGLAERVPAEAVTGDFFGVLGVSTIRGRVLTPGEGRHGGDVPAVISHTLWVRRFGGDAAALSQTVRAGPYQLTIVGIAPPGLERWRREAHVWVPLESVEEPAILAEEGYHLVTPIARLRPAVSAAAAVERLTTIDRAYLDAWPSGSRQHVSRIVPLRDDVVPGTLARALFVVCAAVALTWFVGCANLANLLLARGLRRRSDLAVRLAVGADRWRIVRQLLVEILVLALPAGLLGLILAWWGVQLLVVVGPPSIAGNDAIRMDLAVVAAGAALVLSAVLSGTGPALRLSRVSLQPLLTERGATRRLSSALLIAQVAVAVVMLVAAGLLLKSAWRMTRVDLGFEPRQVLTVRFAFPQKFPAAPSPDLERAWRLAAQTAILERLRKLPGVTEATLSSSVFRPAGDFRSSISLDDGRRFLSGEPDQRAFAPRGHRIGPRYFRIHGTPVLEGREFSDQDTAVSSRVAVVNETMGRLLWPGRSPVGARVNLGRYSPRRGFDEPWHEIVGVVADMRYGEVGAPVIPEIYRAAAQEPLYGGYAVVKTAMAPEVLAGPVRSAIREVDAEIPVYAARTLKDLVNESTSMTRYNSGLLLLCAAVVALLCAFGVYSLLAYAVAARRRELGIRIALGAPPRALIGGVLRQAAWTLLPGLGLGLLSAWATTRVLASLLFEVSARDGTAFSMAAAAIALLGIGAACLPAYRAAEVDAVEALKT